MALVLSSEEIKFASSSSILPVKHSHHDLQGDCSHAHDKRARDMSSTSNTFVRRSFWNTKCKCLFSRLPDELLMFNAFSFLDIKNLFLVSRVCKRWRFLATDKVLWHSIDLSTVASQINDDVLMRSISSRIFSSLMSFRLCNVEDVSSDALVHVSSQLGPQVTEVHLCNVPSLDDDVLTTIAARCSSLRAVSLLGGCSLTDASVTKLVSSCRKLELLSLRNCSKLTLASLRDLPSSLRVLNLSGCKRLSSSDVVTIVSKLPNLRKLSLHAIAVDDDAVSSIVKSCPRLRSVQMSSPNPYMVTSSWSRVTDKAMRALSDSRSLTTLDLTGAHHISDSGVASLLAASAPVASSSSLSLSALSLTPSSSSSPSSVTASSRSLVVHTSSARSFKRLSLGACIKLTDDTLSTLSSSPLTHSLSSLALDNCALITDQGLLALASSVSSLSHLSIDETPVSDSFLSALTAASPLKRPSSSSSSSVSSSFSSSSAAAPATPLLPLLRVLSIRDCASVTPQAIQALQAARPSLTINSSL